MWLYLLLDWSGCGLVEHLAIDTDFCDLDFSFPIINNPTGHIKKNNGLDYEYQISVAI